MICMPLLNFLAQSGEGALLKLENKTKAVIEMIFIAGVHVSLPKHKFDGAWERKGYIIVLQLSISWTALFVPSQ